MLLQQESIDSAAAVDKFPRKVVKSLKYIPEKLGKSQKTFRKISKKVENSSKKSGNLPEKSSELENFEKIKRNKKTIRQIY